MAVFESQVSAQVTQSQKDALAEMLAVDKTLAPATSEADVIRAAIALGMTRLAELEPSQRRRMYALQRRGLVAVSD